RGGGPGGGGGRIEGATPGIWDIAVWAAIGGSAAGHFFLLGLPLLAGGLVPAGPLAMQWAAPADQLGPVGLVAAHADHLVPRPGPAAHQAGSRFHGRSPPRCSTGTRR